MKRQTFYRAALRNLGVAGTARLQVGKRIRPISGTITLTSKQLKFPVVARVGSTDLAVFHQIFVFDEYRCLSEFRPNGLIIDLGANVGYAAAYFLSRFPTCHVVAVEPDPGNYKILVENVSGFDNVTTVQAAIWPRNENLQFNRSVNDGEWGIQVMPGDAAEVKALTIPDLMQLSGYEKISLLKIDIEGAEVDLFSGNYKEWLPLVDNIVIELHGERASQAFFAAINQSRFAISMCDELTVCLEGR